MMPDSEIPKGADPETKTRRKAAQAIAYDIWRQDWRRANPEGSRDERDRDWDAVRGDELKKARRVLAALERGGFRVVRNPESPPRKRPDHAEET